MCIYVYVLWSLLALTDLLYSAGRFWYWRLAFSFFSILSAVDVFVLFFLLSCVAQSWFIVARSPLVQCLQCPRVLWTVFAGFRSIPA